MKMYLQENDENQQTSWQTTWYRPGKGFQVTVPYTLGDILSHLPISQHTTSPHKSKWMIINTVISKVSDVLIYPSMVMNRNFGASLLGSETLLCDIVIPMILFPYFCLCNGAYRNIYFLKGLLKKFKLVNTGEILKVGSDAEFLLWRTWVLSSS